MKAYLELTKPRISLLVAITIFIGYWLGGGRFGTTLIWTLLGTTLAACATGTLNQWWEKDRDALMHRTQLRPLPHGDISPNNALLFGLSLAAAGLAILALKTNLLALTLTAVTIAAYILIYTPLKAVTPQSTWIGAVAGAMPPLIGWAAARGSLSPEAWVLFAIQFLWQIPHFLALFWMYREDYARAGFKVMPVVDPGGRNTSCQIALHSFALILASLIPVLIGMARVSYGWWALTLGAAFLAFCLRVSWTMAEQDAHRMFLASLAYLPLVWILLVLGQAPVEAKTTHLYGRAQSLSLSRSPSELPASWGRVPDFALTDGAGRTVHRSDIQGPWIADFIFTRCTSSCPMLTAQMKRLKKDLPGIRFVSFTLDPTDTPDVLARYAKDEGATWTLLTGKPGQVESLSLEGFHLAARAGAAPSEPILHSTKLVLIDRDGWIRGYFDSGDKQSIRELMHEAQELAGMQPSLQPIAQAAR